ncbi:MAG: DUF2178 domain-containing protein [Candidatus Thorarchaeota archaeon]|nr:DUF2178 domain-containing protein [Candidatus Thorarchaeota archaeon]
MTEEKLSNKSFFVMLICLAFGWGAGQLVTSLIFPNADWPTLVSSAFGGIVFIAVMMGFMIYSQRLRDERTIYISDKAARNGFAFVLFLVPAAIVGLSATDISTDVSLALVLLWFGAVAVASISAFYYYRK